MQKRFTSPTFLHGQGTSLATGYRSRVTMTVTTASLTAAGPSLPSLCRALRTYPLVHVCPTDSSKRACGVGVLLSPFPPRGSPGVFKDTD